MGASVKTVKKANLQEQCFTARKTEMAKAQQQIEERLAQALTDLEEARKARDVTLT